MWDNLNKSVACAFFLNKSNTVYVMYSHINLKNKSFRE